MKFRPSIASRARDVAWNWKRGRDSQGRPFRSLAGKAYLPSEPAPQPTALPGDDTGAAAASNIPAPTSPSAAGQSPTVAKLGLRYER